MENCGEGSAKEELIAELSEAPLTAFLFGVLKDDYNDKACYAERIEKREGFD